MSGEAKQEPRLLSEFKPAKYADWRKQAEEALDGAPFEKKLLTQTYEGITLQPIYNAQDTADTPSAAGFPGIANFARGISASGYAAERWEVAQELTSATAIEFNNALRQDLERGQTAIRLRPDDAARRGADPEGYEQGVCRGGVSLAAVKDLEAALTGVDLKKMPLYIDGGAGGPAVAAMLFGLAKKLGVKAREISGGVLSDPLSVLAQAGELPAPLESLFNVIGAYTRWAEMNASPKFKTIGVSVSVYQEASASAVEELAYAVATGVEYLRRLSAPDLSIDAVCSRMQFEFAQGPQFFMELSKLRAARILWQQVVKAFGGNEQAQRMQIFARTGRYQKTAFDPFVNLLRTTTEAFSAVAGGAQSLHVSPFNEVYAEADDAARRYARNAQIILQEECNLTEVIDPAGGSYLVEKLTAELSESAWKLFQEIEAEGGMLKALVSGSVQARLKKLAQARRRKLEERRDVLVGTNLYANTAEAGPAPSGTDRSRAAKRRIAEVRDFRSSLEAEADEAILTKLNELVNSSGAERFALALDAAKAGASLGEISRALRAASGSGESCEALELGRLAEPYERLRLAALKYKAAEGRLPQLFLANMGPLRQHKARADFCAGFFEVGGFQVIYPNGFADAQAAAKAFADSGAKLAVICSTDETYPELVPALSKALKGAVPGASVLMAGFPGDHEAAYREAGLDDYIFIKSNNYQVLERYLGKLGVL